MKIALTGATGFIGRYLAQHLSDQGHALRCWSRSSSNREGFDRIPDLEWVEGELGDRESAAALVKGCDAVIHAALYRPGMGFRGAEGDLVEFVQKNVIGTLELIEAARHANINRFVFISSCAVHEKILDDRPLDETHPLWATSHYGAHKAAIEKFIHSYGLGEGYPICALRPTGVYGVAHPIQDSKWFDLVSRVVRGETIQCSRGGKEVHAADVPEEDPSHQSRPGARLARPLATRRHDRDVPTPSALQKHRPPLGPILANKRQLNTTYFRETHTLAGIVQAEGMIDPGSGRIGGSWDPLANSSFARSARAQAREDGVFSLALRAIVVSRTERLFLK